MTKIIQLMWILWGGDSCSPGISKRPKPAPNMSKEKMGVGISHPNIALIKYWGKKDVGENIPTNSSISITTKELETVTRVYENEFEDELFLDGEKVFMTERHRKITMLFKKMNCYSGFLKIVSENNFPHSCGLASSASGFSALVLALENFFQQDLGVSELSRLSRIGSGSAARSSFPGFSIFDGESARKLEDWDDLRILVVIVKNTMKKVGSTEGMMRTVRTSPLFQQRLKDVDKKIQEMTRAIKERDFEKLAILTMRDSNEVHATCLDSWPPINYLNDDSFHIIDLCLRYNERNGTKVAYTFDAGPNAFIITRKEDFNSVMKYLSAETSHKIITAL